MNHLAWRVLREPLVHFLLLGFGLFFVFRVVRDPGRESPNRIVVSTGQIEQLAVLFTRTWQRPPSADELEGLIEEHIREEVLYREALAMGLDRDDTVVRRRLRQKVEFLTNDLLATPEPTEKELRKYLAENVEDFRIGPQFSFTHLFFNPVRHGDELYRVADRVLRDLQGTGSFGDAAPPGDSFLLGTEFDLESEDRIAGEFGQHFASRLAELPLGRWSGPVESSFGVHLVKVTERIPGRVPAFDAIGDAVARDWRAARRKEASESIYQNLRQRYTVNVEGIPGTDDGRVAEASEVLR